MTAYTNAGNLEFEQDFKRKDGFVVAKIVNNTRCETRGIKLKPGRTYFWVVENRGTSARLVAADDDIKLKKFTSCGAQGFPGAGGPGETVAMLKAKSADPKQGECDHRRTPDRGRLGSAAPSVGVKGTPMRFASTSKRQESRGFVVWITCAQDCCYGEE